MFMLCAGVQVRERILQDRSDLAHDDTVEALTEPCGSLLLGDTVLGTNTAVARLALCDPEAGAAHDGDHVHTEDAHVRVVLDAQVDVLGDTEAEVAGVAEVSTAQFVLLDLQATFQDLLCLGSTNGDVAGDLFVTTDTESTEGVASLGGDGGLTGQLLQHLGSTGQSVTRLSDGNVDDQLLYAELLLSEGGKVSKPFYSMSRSQENGLYLDQYQFAGDLQRPHLLPKTEQIPRTLLATIASVDRSLCAEFE